MVVVNNFCCLIISLNSSCTLISVAVGAGVVVMSGFGGIVNNFCCLIILLSLSCSLISVVVGAAVVVMSGLGENITGL